MPPPQKTFADRWAAFEDSEKKRQIAKHTDFLPCSPLCGEVTRKLATSPTRTRAPPPGAGWGGQRDKSVGRGKTRRVFKRYGERRDTELSDESNIDTPYPTPIPIHKPTNLFSKLWVRNHFPVYLPGEKTSMQMLAGTSQPLRRFWGRPCEETVSGLCWSRWAGNIGQYGCVLRIVAASILFHPRRPPPPHTNNYSLPRRRFRHFSSPRGSSPRPRRA